MSDTLNAAAKALQEKMGDRSLDGSVKFEIKGEGAIRLEGDQVTVDDAEADCTLSAEQDVFEAMIAGDLDPTAAFMTGKLSVDGDMSKAMQLASVLG